MANTREYLEALISKLQAKTARNCLEEKTLRLARERLASLTLEPNFLESPDCGDWASEMAEDVNLN